MNGIEDQIFALRLFNEKVEELLNSSFIKSVSDPEAGFSLHIEIQKDGGSKIVTTVRGPSVESVKAFVLTFRFFIQDNELTSLRNMAILYNSENINPQQRKLFQSARDAVNKLLDSPNIHNFIINGITPTNRQVLLVFIYGGLAHAEPEKYKTYKEWMNFPPSAVFLHNNFITLLGDILNALIYLKGVNEETLNQLKR